MILAGTQVGLTGGGQTQCADVVLNPDSADALPEVVSLSTTTAGAHIFYRANSPSPLPPQHSGDSAIAPTVRIGSNSGSVTISGAGGYLTAKAYKSGLLDSNITSGFYFNTPGGGGG